MEEKNYKQNPKSQEALFSYSKSLYETRQYKELEKIFGKHLRKSTDSAIWDLYVEYVKKVSTKQVSLKEVYTFLLNQLGNSYDVCPFVKGYLDELEKEEDGPDIEKIRQVYHEAFKTPMHGLGLLWSEYEKWEYSVQKPTAHITIESIQPDYQLTMTTYHRLLPYIQSNQYYSVLDIELENPLHLKEKPFKSRLEFIIKYYIDKNPAEEGLLFLHSFYLKTLPGDFKESLTPFLSVWYSFQHSTDYFSLEKGNNMELVSVFYLNWLLKTEGLDAFRTKSKELCETSGPYVFIYSAYVEYYQGGSKENAYSILNAAAARLPENPILLQYFFDLFVRIGDDESIRLLFRKLKRTYSMWDTMLRYEMQYGEINTYMELLQSYGREVAAGECLNDIPQKPALRTSGGCFGVYQRAKEDLSFIDLSFNAKDIFQEFLDMLPSLSAEENILSLLDTEKLVDVISNY